MPGCGRRLCDLSHQVNCCLPSQDQRLLAFQGSTTRPIGFVAKNSPKFRSEASSDLCGPCLPRSSLPPHVAYVCLKASLHLLILAPTDCPFSGVHSSESTTSHSRSLSTSTKQTLVAKHLCPQPVQPPHSFTQPIFHPILPVRYLLLRATHRTQHIVGCFHEAPVVPGWRMLLDRAGPMAPIPLSASDSPGRIAILAITSQTSPKNKSKEAFSKP